jgi:hypothetical protein
MSRKHLDTAKALPRRKFIINVYISEDRSQINHLTLYTKELEKELTNTKIEDGRK